jgi:hypothetical protein
MTYDTNVFINGWTHTSSTSAFICGKQGLYNIDFQVNPNSNNNADMIIEARALKNRTEIIGSYQFNQVLDSIDSFRMTNSFMVSANVNDDIGFQWSASNTNGRLLTTPTIGAGAGHTTNQSTSVRITRIL